MQRGIFGPLEQTRQQGTTNVASTQVKVSTYVQRFSTVYKKW